VINPLFLLLPLLRPPKIHIPRIKPLTRKCYHGKTGWKPTDTSGWSSNKLHEEANKAVERLRNESKNESK